MKTQQTPKFVPTQDTFNVTSQEPWVWGGEQIPNQDQSKPNFERMASNHFYHDAAVQAELGKTCDDFINNMEEGEPIDLIGIDTIIDTRPVSKDSKPEQSLRPIRKVIYFFFFISLIYLIR